MLDGRVKTLHPKIHAGILNKRNNKLHKKQMNNHGYKNIDLVIVNFYSFENLYVWWLIRVIVINNNKILSK